MANKIAEALVVVRADTATLRGDLNRMKSETDGFFSSMTRSAGMVGGAIGAYMGGRQLVNFVRQSVSAYAEQEDAVASLGAAMALAGKFSKESLTRLSEYAKELQKTTTYTDESVLKIMAFGQALGRMTEDQLKASTKAAIGWSEIIGVDATAAMKMLARAAQGNFATWSKYTNDLQKFNTDAEKMDFLMRRGAEGFTIAEARAGALGGQITQLKNLMGDKIFEDFGKGFAEGLNVPEKVEAAKAGVEGSNAEVLGRGAGKIVDVGVALLTTLNKGIQLGGDVIGMGSALGGGAMDKFNEKAFGMFSGPGAKREVAMAQAGREISANDLEKFRGSFGKNKGAISAAWSSVFSSPQTVPQPSYPNIVPNTPPLDETGGGTSFTESVTTLSGIDKTNAILARIEEKIASGRME